MKKLLALVLVAVIAAYAIPSFAADAPVVSVELKNPAQSTANGNEYYVSVKIDNPSDLFAYDLTVDYDANYLKALKVEPETADGIIAINNIDAEKGQIRFVYSLYKSASNGVLANIKFKSLKDGSATIKVNKATVLSKKYALSGAGIGYKTSDLTLTLGQAGSSEPMFSDITDHWARADIEDMARRGVINGIGDGLFAPEQNITRAEFVALLTKTATLSEYKGGLSDVAAEEWYAKYIQTGIDLGIIPAEMTASGSFAPLQPITREEMCAMIVNAYKTNTGKDLPAGDSGSFTDESSFTPWAVGSINAAAKAKIVNGVDEGIFAAKANATRAEAATIVKRLLDMN